MDWELTTIGKIAATFIFLALAAGGAGMMVLASSCIYAIWGK